MSKPKTIDLTKLTPEERCRVMVDTVDSRYLIKNYKLNQPDVETTTTNSLIDQQAIVDFKRNNTELYPYKYGEIKIEPNVITYNGKIYVAIDSFNPTFEEVKKEWEELEYECIEFGKKSVTLVKNVFNVQKIVIEIHYSDCYEDFVYRKYGEAYDSRLFTLEEHKLISKTCRAMEAENVKN